MNIAEIIKKWYEKLGFPAEYDSEFYKALSDITISDDTSIETYDVDCTDGKRNLLSYLYMCEQLNNKYMEAGIPSVILTDSLQDIVHWAKVWTKLKKELYLGELFWLKQCLNMSMFKLGRLQYRMAGASKPIHELNVAKGDPILEVHIPSYGDFSPSECDKSIEMAKGFFTEYFPSYDYKCFTCHSWLLDPTLKEMLKADSNIINFQNRYTFVSAEPSDAILKYLFQWNTTRDNLSGFPASSRFAERVKCAVENGRTFNEALGYFKK